MPEPPNPLNTTFDPEDEYRPEPEPEPLPPNWMDGGLRIGIHASIAGSFLNALESARKLGCNALQIFSASPRMWVGGATRIAEVDAKAFRERRAALGLGPLVIHANYLINLAAVQPMQRARSIQAFHEELVRGVMLGADFLVVHPGSRGDVPQEQALASVAASVRQAGRGVPFGPLRILIENTAGMGTAVGWRLEEVAQILAGLTGLPCGACLDTAHLFAAGYDFRTEAALAQTIGAIDRTIGIERVPVFHVNDSKVPMGARVDRHEHIGKGKIGLEAFRRLLRHPRLGAAGPEGLAGRAFLLETPIDEPGDDRRNVKALWELAGLADQAPAAEKGFSMLAAGMKNIKKRMETQRTQQARKARSLQRPRAKGKRKKAKPVKRARRRG